MKITNLTKSFGTKIIFNNADFTFNESEITFIMGESGVGKTTLLRILAGLDIDFTGVISPLGKIAYVFQEPRLFPHTTVLDNIKVVNDNSPFDAIELLKILELEGCEKMLPSELSGGMKMRLSIARAIFYDADVILMDEPFGSLDEETKKRIAPKIFELLAGKTIIIVSHSQTDASLYANNIISI